MYHCHRCGREVSAMEVVLHPPEKSDEDNIVLCPVCSEAVNQSRMKIRNANWRAFWLAIILCISLVIVWSALLLITASTWEVFAVFSGWIIGVYFNRQRYFTAGIPKWGLAVVFTTFVILLREWIMLSLVAISSMGIEASGYFLPPMADVWRIFVVQISVNPTMIFLWFISIGIAGLTANRR